MTITDKDNKKLRQEKKSPLRPMSAKEIRASFERMKGRMGIKVSSPCEGQ